MHKQSVEMIHGILVTKYVQLYVCLQAMPIKDAAAMSGEIEPNGTEMNNVVAKENSLGHGLWLQRLMAGEFTRLKCACVLECPEHVPLFICAEWWVMFDKHYWWHCWRTWSISTCVQCGGSLNIWFDTCWNCNCGVLPELHEYTIISINIITSVVYCHEVLEVRVLKSTLHVHNLHSICMIHDRWIHVVHLMPT